MNPVLFTLSNSIIHEHEFSRACGGNMLVCNKLRLIVSLKGNIRNIDVTIKLNVHGQHSLDWATPNLKFLNFDIILANAKESIQGVFFVNNLCENVHTETIPSALHF